MAKDAVGDRRRAVWGWESGRVRVFAAVWPPQGVLDHLDLAIGAVRRRLGSAAGTGPVRWSARETWHLTCAFYGDVADGRMPELSRELAAVAAGTAPYGLALRGAGMFAHRTLWVGVGGDVAAQRELARSAVAAGRAVGVRPDERPRERAHLTIGRVRGGGRPGNGGPGRRDRGDAGRVRLGAGRWSGVPDAVDAVDPDGVVAALAVYEGPAWTVDALRLVASRPGEGRGGGPAYETVEELAFGWP